MMTMFLESLYNKDTDEIFIYLIAEKPNGEQFYAKPILVEFVPNTVSDGKVMSKIMPAMILQGEKERRDGIFEALCRAFTNAFLSRQQEKWKLNSGMVKMDEEISKALLPLNEQISRVIRE